MLSGREQGMSKCVRRVTRGYLRKVMGTIEDTSYSKYIGSNANVDVDLDAKNVWGWYQLSEVRKAQKRLAACESQASCSCKPCCVAPSGQRGARTSFEVIDNKGILKNRILGDRICPSH